MKKFLFLAFVFISIISCGKKNKKDDSYYKENAKAYERKMAEEKMQDSILNLPPIAISFDEAIMDSMRWDRMVIIEGYLQLPQSMSLSQNTQSLDFYGRENQINGVSIKTQITVGDGNNKMKRLAEKYSIADIFIKDKNGIPVNINDRVRLLGKMSIHKAYGGSRKYNVSIDCKEIEKIEDITLDYASFNWPVLAFEEYKKKENYNKMFVLEGMLSPSIVTNVDFETNWELKDEKGKKFTVYFITGNNSNNIEYLEKGWKIKDIRLHKNNGDLVNLSKKVKVYGMLKPGGFHIEEIVQ